MRLMKKKKSKNQISATLMSPKYVKELCIKIKMKESVQIS